MADDSSDCDSSEFDEKPYIENETNDVNQKDAVNKNLTCDFPGCTKIFKKPSLLSQHIVTHTKEKAFSCDECGKKFLRQYHLKRHTLTVHKEKTEFTCTYEGCNYKCNLKYNMNRHIKRNHETDLPFKCSFEECGKSFKKHKSLFLHEATHKDGKPFKCTFEGCNKSFTKNNNLNKHLKIHRNEKAYICNNDNCNAMFYTWSDLRKHIFTCTVHQCQDCGKIFKAAWRLNNHKKTHLENRVLYKCPVEGCENEYTQQRNVLAHVRINHEGQSTFQCPDEQCGQTFVYKVSLNRHLKNHDHILKTYKKMAKNKKKKEKKRRKQKRLHASAVSKVSGFIHELGHFINKSDVDPNNETSDINVTTTTEDDSDENENIVSSHINKTNNSNNIQTETFNYNIISSDNSRLSESEITCQS